MLPMVSAGDTSDARPMQNDLNRAGDITNKPRRSLCGHRFVWRAGLIAMAFVTVAGCNSGSSATQATQADPVPVDDPPDEVGPGAAVTEAPENGVQESEVPDTEGVEDGAGLQIETGAPFEDTCTIAWPTAPSRSSQGTQIRTTCSGVDTGEYQFVDILVLDPDLEVTPSNSTVRVRGEVLDVIESEMGFTTLAVIATEADIA